MRFVRRDVRDLIAHQKNGHGASYRRHRILQRLESSKIRLSRDFRCRPIFDFCDTIEGKAEIGWAAAAFDPERKSRAGGRAVVPPI